MTPRAITTFLPSMHRTTTDFDFLRGAFDVTSRRLSDPFDPESGWVTAQATSNATTHFAGAVSIDEMYFPAEGNHGMSLRLFDPVERTWTVYWVDSRNGVLQSPVTGAWENGRCWLTGPDEYAGRPILASYSWSDVTDGTARWEQCFSFDDGVTWLPNWTMNFTRRASDPVVADASPRVADDFNFLSGRWRVHHRRLPDPLSGGSQWIDFDGVMEGHTYMAGGVSVDECSLADPGRRGLTFRTYDPLTEQWSIYWVNSAVGRLEPAVRGGFMNGIGTFYGVEQVGGREVHVRFVWSDISATSARWQQAFSLDGGAMWADNWEMRFTREAEE